MAPQPFQLAREESSYVINDDLIIIVDGLSSQDYQHGPLVVAFLRS